MAKKISRPMQRLLSLMASLRRLPPLSELSGDEERILFELRLLWHKQGNLSLADVYQLGQKQSAITLYRQVVALQEKGLVKISVSKYDKRKREVTFTDVAESIFSAFE